MRTDYACIFLGCSCFALGCAAQAPGDSLILESGEGLGGEFVDALRADGRPILCPSGPAAGFYDELTARGILSDASAARGEIHLPAVNVVLNRLALERRLQILFRTRPVFVRRTAAGFSVTAVCNARLLSFTCRRLIDTRAADFARIRRLDENARAALGANLHADAPAGEKMGPFSLQKGFLPGEVFAHFPVAAPDPRNREALLSAFERRPAAFLSARLLTVAPVVAVWCRPLREENEQGLFIPGCGFANPIQAWAAGLSEKEALDA